MLFCALLLIVLPICALAQAVLPPEIHAQAAVLLEGESGRELFAVNADEPRPIASTTKIMTALVVLENCDLDGKVTVSENASGVPGTSLYLGAGEVLTVEQMLEGLLLRSGNDAAVALAEYVSGSVPAFAQEMNARAIALGAKAHFVNPHGLDEKGHEASARAMALSAREALAFPDFRRLVTTKRALIPWPGNPYDRVLVNKNKLLDEYPDATGVKTGFTTKAGRCLVFSAKRNEMEIVGALLGAPNWFKDAQSLLDWAFAAYDRKSFLYQNQTVGAARVEGGMEERVKIVAPRALWIPLRAEEDARLVIEMAPSVQAPVYAGDVLGMARVLCDGTEIASMPLVAARGVPVRSYLGSFYKVLRHFCPVS